MIRVELTRGQIEAIVDGLPYSEHRDRGTARVVMERALKDGDGRPFPDRPPNVAVEVSPAMQAIAAEQPEPGYECPWHGFVGHAVVRTAATNRHAAAEWCLDCLIEALPMQVRRVTRKEAK